MTSRDFCYWLQGFMELRVNNDSPISVDQASCIQKHLSLVFEHEIDPIFGDEKKQAALNKLHHLSDVDPFGPKMRC